MQEVIIYTDGACSGNPGVGGWAAVLTYNNVQKSISGGEKVTTNNRMELQAVIAGLSALKYKCKVQIYSDSAYVVNAFTQNWIKDWRANGWRTKGKKDVANKELWLELLRLSEIHQITLNKVKGHSDVELNNLCGQLARAEIKKINR